MNITVYPYIVTFPENEVIVQSSSDSKVTIRIRENGTNHKVHIQTFEFLLPSASTHWAQFCYTHLLRLSNQDRNSSEYVLHHVKSLQNLMTPIIRAALVSK